MQIILFTGTVTTRVSLELSPGEMTMTAVLSPLLMISKYLAYRHDETDMSAVFLTVQEAADNKRNAAT